MFIRATGGYTASGQQHSTGMYLFLTMPARYVSQAPFLEQRAFLRRVTLKQLGHFMMGEIKLSGVKLTVSGPCGSDGLPATVPEYVFSHGYPVPERLTKMWAESSDDKPTNWQSEMRHWANANETEIRRRGRKLEPARFVLEPQEMGMVREHRFGLTAPGFIVDKLFNPTGIDGANEYSIASYARDYEGGRAWLEWSETIPFRPPKNYWGPEEAVRLLNLWKLGDPADWAEQLEEYRSRD